MAHTGRKLHVRARGNDAKEKKKSSRETSAGRERVAVLARVTTLIAKIALGDSVREFERFALEYLCIVIFSFHFTYIPIYISLLCKTVLCIISRYILL